MPLVVIFLRVFTVINYDKRLNIGLASQAGLGSPLRSFGLKIKMTSFMVCLSILKLESGSPLCSDESVFVCRYR